MVVFNNRSYYQDEGHQHIMAVTRDRPVGNVGTGIHLRDPEVDFATVARGLGVEAFGPVLEPGALRPALEQALRIVQREGRPALVDVITQPR
jgi:thiamine pyrophosphate-dependent acetolactate synthase large subunit-like protein